MSNRHPYIEFSYHSDREGDEVTVKIPQRWVICQYCGGCGTRALAGMAFTATEFSCWDIEEQDDYMRGRYDRTCEECRGAGKVLEVDADMIADDEVREAWDYEQVGRWELAAEMDAERRAGC